MRDLKKIDYFVERMEKASLILVSELGLDFLDSLIIVAHDFLYAESAKDLDKESQIKLNNIYRSLKRKTYLNEEIRLAMELLIIKAFKHKFRYPLSLMTPDSINYLFAYFIGELSSPQQSVLEVGLGTGNLITAIANYTKHPLELIGVERDETLVKLAKINADLQGNQIKIYFNDFLDPLYEKVDFVIADLDRGEEEYFPYQVILKALELLNEQGFFILLIDNDFFNQKEIVTFKEKFSGTLLGIIILPDTLFQNNIIGKSILIGSKKYLKSFEMMATSLPSVNDAEELNKIINQLDEWLKQVKGMIL